MNYKKLKINTFNLNSLYNINTTLTAKTISALQYDEKRLNFINDNYQKYVGNPFDFKLMDQATYLVKKSIINQEKILLYGDYESDGIYSTAILSKVLESFEARYAYYIPNKYVDGKGLNANIVKMIIRKGYKLVVCLGNGVDSKTEIETLRNHGIEVIVVDHRKREVYPTASALINPDFTSKETSFETTSAILTYKFVKALIGYYDDFCFSVAGLSLVDSRVNLNDENYHFLKRTLYILNNRNYQFLTLLSRKQHFVDIDILKEIDRKINSFCIISHANDVNKLPLLFSSNEKEENIAFSKIVNRYRKQFKENLSQFISEIKKYDLNDDIVVGDVSNIDEGYVYSVLSSSIEKDKKFMLGLNLQLGKLYYLSNLEIGNNFGFLVIENIFFNSISEAMDVLKSKYKNIKIDELSYNLIPIDENDLTVEGIKNLEIISPYGLSNKEPLFLLKNISKDLLTLSVNGLHLVGKLNENIYLAAYEQGHKYDKLKDKLSIVIRPCLNYFDEKMSVSCMILDFLEEEK